MICSLRVTSVPCESSLMISEKEEEQEDVILKIQNEHENSHDEDDDEITIEIKKKKNPNDKNESHNKYDKRWWESTKFVPVGMLTEKFDDDDQQNAFLSCSVCTMPMMWSSNENTTKRKNIVVVTHIEGPRGQPLRDFRNEIV